MLSVVSDAKFARVISFYCYSYLLLLHSLSRLLGRVSSPKRDKDHDDSKACWETPTRSNFDTINRSIRDLTQRKRQHKFFENVVFFLVKTLTLICFIGVVVDNKKNS